MSLLILQSGLASMQFANTVYGETFERKNFGGWSRK